MKNEEKLSLYEKFFSLKNARDKASQLKTKYIGFLSEIFSPVEVDEKVKKLEENIDKLKHNVEIGDLFFIDVACILLFLIVGLQVYFQEYFNAYKIILLIIFAILICTIFLNIHKNKIKFQRELYNFIKTSWLELVNPNKYYDRLGTDILMITLGSELNDYADTEQGGNLLPRIAKLRKKLTEELGYVIPNVRVIPSVENEPKEFDIWVRGKLVAKGDVSDKPEFLDDADVITEELHKVVLSQVNYILSLNSVYKMTELVRSRDALLVDYMKDYVDSLDIRNILVSLLEQKLSIKDIELIYLKIADYARDAENIDDLIIKLKADLKKLNKIGKDFI